MIALTGELPGARLGREPVKLVTSCEVQRAGEDHGLFRKAICGDDAGPARIDEKNCERTAAPAEIERAAKVAEQSLAKRN